MAISVTHAFTSPVGDEGNSNEIGPNEWNAAHTVTGAVAAPASTTDNAIARFDGTSGQIQNSAPTIDDTGALFVNVNTNSTIPAPGGGSIVMRLVGGDAANTRMSVSAFGGSANIAFSRANGTNASPTQVLSTNQIGIFSAYGYHSGGGYAGGRAQFTMTATENWTSTAQGAKLDFQTTPNGSTTIATVVTISHDGNLQMGANSDTVITSSRHPQLRSYTVATLPSAATAGQLIYVSDETGGAVPCFSDGTNWRRVTDRSVAA